jgi:hypothetical protein
MAQAGRAAAAIRSSASASAGSLVMNEVWAYARAVKIALAFAVDQVGAVAGDRNGIVLTQVAVEDVGHQ